MNIKRINLKVSDIGEMKKDALINCLVEFVNTFCALLDEIKENPADPKETDFILVENEDFLTDEAGNRISTQ